MIHYFGGVYHSLMSQIYYYNFVTCAYPFQVIMKSAPSFFFLRFFLIILLGLRACADIFRCVPCKTFTHNLADVSDHDKCRRIGFIYDIF